MKQSKQKHKKVLQDRKLQAIQYEKDVALATRILSEIAERTNNKKFYLNKPGVYIEPIPWTPFELTLENGSRVIVR